jgi:hypothetical protein
MPIGIIGTMLLLNAGVVYWFSRKMWISNIKEI